jgi:hypothetical protein
MDRWKTRVSRFIWGFVAREGIDGNAAAATMTTGEGGDGTARRPMGRRVEGLLSATARSDGQKKGFACRPIGRLFVVASLGFS